MDMEQTLEQRCKVALECLPDARYRTMLARLFGDLLARAAVPVVQPTWQPIQQEPKPDSVYPVQPSSEAATARDAALTLDQQYWLDRRADIIEALRREGVGIWGGKKRGWVHRKQ